MDIASKYDLEAIKARNKYLEDKLEAIKKIAFDRLEPNKAYKIRLIFGGRARARG